MKGSKQSLGLRIWAPPAAVLRRWSTSSTAGPPGTRAGCPPLTSLAVPQQHHLQTQACQLLQQGALTVPADSLRLIVHASAHAQEACTQVLCSRIGAVAAPTCRRFCGQPGQRLARRLPGIHHRAGAARDQRAAAVPCAELVVVLRPQDMDTCILRSFSAACLPLGYCPSCAHRPKTTSYA